jgi:hypothetical protein
MRPSSLLRGARLSALVAELAVRELDNAGAAKLLRCSASSARNYLLELMDAGAVDASSDRSDGADRTVYRLNPDKLGQGAFDAAGLIAGNPVAAAARDPLVAALFGAHPAL